MRRLPALSWGYSDSMTLTRRVLTTSNEFMTNTLAQLNGLKEASDLNAEQASLEAYIDTYEGLEWAGANLDEVRARLDDLKNQKFWEQYNADLEAAASSAEDAASAVVELTAEEKKLAEAAAGGGRRVARACCHSRCAAREQPGSRAGFGAALPAAGIGAIQLPTAELIGVLESRPLEGVDLLGIGAGAERATRQLQAAGADGGPLLTAALDESTSAWASGGGLSGMFTGITGAVGAFATGGWKSGIMSMANTAMSFLPPGMSQVAQASLAAISAVWSAMKRPRRRRDPGAEDVRRHA